MARSGTLLVGALGLILVLGLGATTVGSDGGKFLNPEGSFLTVDRYLERLGQGNIIVTHCREYDSCGPGVVIPPGGGDLPPGGGGDHVGDASKCDNGGGNGDEKCDPEGSQDPPGGQGNTDDEPEGEPGG